MLFTTELVLAACIGAAMAGPTHLHRHRDVHAKKDLADVDWVALDWDSFGIDWSSAWAAGQKTATTATPVATAAASPIIAAAVTTSAAAAKSTSTSATSTSETSSIESEVASVISDITTAWSTLIGLANLRTTFGTATATSGSDVGFIGNIGNPPGSNMLLVSSITGYDFSATFTNTQSVPITILIWNKAAVDSAGVVQANLGSCLAYSDPIITITLAAGASQAVAFMDETQIGFAQAVSGKTAAGAPDTTWGECNFVSTGSGYDVSSIVNSKGNTYNMKITSTESSCISDITQNDWIANNGDENDPIPIGDSDGSCYVPGSTMHLQVSMGGDI